MGSLRDLAEGLRRNHLNGSAAEVEAAAERMSILEAIASLARFQANCRGGCAECNASWRSCCTGYELHQLFVKLDEADRSSDATNKDK